MAENKITYTFVFERKLLKALVFLSNNPEFPEVAIVSEFT
jgi:hypothetical protein